MFYSVLVSKAALYGFTAWAACVVVIVFGLGATLVLLAVYRMALPVSSRCCRCGIRLVAFVVVVVGAATAFEFVAVDFGRHVRGGERHVVYR